MRKAVLIIHGFGGGTFDEEILANTLEFDKRLDVYSFTLPGHNNDFNKVTKEDWMNSARDHMNMLIKHGYKKIYLIGHSMGGVIATKIAGEYKEVKKLVLAAPAFKYASDGTKLNIVDTIKSGRSILKQYSLEDLFKRYFKLPKNAIREFKGLVKENYDAPLSINVPILIIRGNKDTVVPLSSCEYVFNSVQSKYKRMIVLKDADHSIYSGNRSEDISNETLKFLKKKFYPKDSLTIEL